MSRFIETLKLENGRPENLSFHQQRFERTRHEVLGLTEHPDLACVLSFPGKNLEGIRKCRVLYENEIEEIQVGEHLKKQVNSLKLVYSEDINYAYKYSDRNSLDELYGLRAECDDILIVKNNLLTDSYMSNLVLGDGTNWHTPDSPLLSGTRRASLLEKGMIIEKRITVDMIPQYKEIRLINALNDLEQAPRIRTSLIR